MCRVASLFDSESVHAAYTNLTAISFGMGLSCNNNDAIGPFLDFGHSDGRS